MSHINTSSASVVVATTAQGISSIVDRCGDALAGLGILSRGLQVEDRFEKMRDRCKLLESHYKKIEGIFSHLHKAHKTMEEAMHMAGKDFLQVEASFSALQEHLNDSDNTGLMTNLSVLYEEQAKSLYSFADIMKSEVIAPIHEHDKYCLAMSQALKVREERQANVEELAQYLSRSKHQLAELCGTQFIGEDPDSSVLAPLKSGVKSVGNYFSDHLDRMKGIDTITAKRQKIVQLEQRIVDLEAALQAARETSKSTDESVVREYEHVIDVLEGELKGVIIPRITTLHAEYFCKTNSRWTL